jgi:hypothetical protein
MQPLTEGRGRRLQVADTVFCVRRVWRGGGCRVKEGAETSLVVFQRGLGPSVLLPPPPLSAPPGTTAALPEKVAVQDSVGIAVQESVEELRNQSNGPAPRGRRHQDNAAETQQLLTKATAAVAGGEAGQVTISNMRQRLPLPFLLVHLTWLPMRLFQGTV